MKTRWYKYLTVLFVFLFIFPLNIRAECDYKRLAELNRLASNVQFNYSYELNKNNIPEFTVDITNVVSDIYVADDNGNVITSDILLKYENGGQIQYTIFSNDNNCKDEKLFDKFYTLPIFNQYFKTDECKRNPDFELCQMWNDVDLFPSEFSALVAKYEKQKDLNISNGENQLLENFNAKIVIYSLLCVCIIAVIIFAVLKIRRKRK